MSKLKLKARVKYLASIFNGVGTSIRKDGLAAYVDVDFTQFSEVVTYDPATQVVLIMNTVDGSYSLVSLATLVTSSQTTQVITSGSTVNVAATDGLIILNKTVSGATAVNLPPSATKIGKIKIVDWKGDSTANPITVNADGTEKFNGGGSSWVISGDGSSTVFDPIPTGIGYGV